MNVRRVQGECVSCGRLPPWPHYRECPYCGEQVRMPVWWSCGRVALVLALAVLAGALFLLSRPDFSEAREALGILPVVKRFLLVAGGAVLLMPCPDGDVIVTSHRELQVWQVKSLVGCVFIGGALYFSGLCFAFAVTSGVWSRLLAALIAGGLLALPYFYRLPWWRVGFVVAVLGAVFLQLHNQYSF